MKLSKSDNPDKYGYSNCGIGYEGHSQFPLPIGEWSENAVFLYGH